MIPKSTIFALLFCIPLLVGCGDKGLWTWDSSGVPGSPTSLITTISPKILMPKTSISASIRAALDTGSTQWTITLNDTAQTKVTLSPDTTNTSEKYPLGFKAVTPIDVKNLAKNAAGDKYVISANALLNGVSFSLKFELPVLLGSKTAGATTTDPAIVLTSITSDVSGTVTYKYDLLYIPFGSTTETTLKDLNPPTGVKNTLPSLYIEKITYKSGTTETILSASELTGVDYGTPRFIMYFNQSIAALPATYSVSVKTTGGTTVSFDNSDNKLATMTLDATKKQITLDVFGQTGDKKLSAGTTYEITFNSALIQSAQASTITATIAAGTTYKMTTKTP